MVRSPPVFFRINFVILLKLRINWGGGGRNLVMLSSMIYNIPNLQKKASKMHEIAFRRP